MDPFICHAELNFQTEDGNVSAPSLINCAFNQEDALIGARLQICYTHDQPTGEALVRDPESLIPIQYEDEQCAILSYKGALRCRKAFFPVMYGFVACVLLLVLIPLYICIDRSCKICLKRKRVVSPEKSTEMTLEHL